MSKKQVSDRVAQGFVTADDLASAFAELAREFGFTPPYVFGMEHDKETGEIIILTGLAEQHEGMGDGLLKVIRTEVNQGGPQQLSPIRGQEEGVA